MGTCCVWMILAALTAGSRPPAHLEEEEDARLLRFVPLVLAVGTHGFAPSHVVPRRAPSSHKRYLGRVARTSLLGVGKGNELEPQEHMIESLKSSKKDPFYFDEFKMQLPPVDKSLLPYVVEAELGAILSDAAYFSSSSDAAGSYRSITAHIRNRVPGPIKVRTVYSDPVLDLVMYGVTFQLNGLDTGALVFRGTTGPLNGPNWKNNLRLNLSKDKKKPAGIWDNYRAIRRHVQPALRKLSRGRSPAQIINKLPGGLFVYGHSMGGALATYAAMDILDIFEGDTTVPPHWLQVMTYGQIREYTESMAEQANKRLNKFRFVAEGDPVPSWPLSLHTMSIPRAKDLWQFLKPGKGDREDAEVLLARQTELAECLDVLQGTKQKQTFDGLGWNEEVSDNDWEHEMSRESTGGKGDRVDSESDPGKFVHSGIPIYLDRGEKSTYKAFLSTEQDFSGPDPADFMRTMLNTRHNLVDLHLSPHYIVALEKVREELEPFREDRFSNIPDDI